MKYRKPLLFLLLFLLLFFLARTYHLQDHVEELRQWIASLGPLGPLAYGLIYALAVIFAIPGSLLTILAGTLFGSILGVIVVSIASTLGATGAFLLARFIAREAVEKKLHNNPKFARLYDMTETHGAIMVAITRLIPLFPFTLLNYGFGLTRVPLKTYVFWSWLCMLPGTVLYVVGTDAVVRTIKEGKIPWVLLGVVVGVGVLISFLARAGKKTIQRKDENHESKPSPLR